MEIDSVVALKPPLNKLEITYSIGILFNIRDGFGEAKSVAPLLVVVPIKATTHFGGKVDLMISNTTAKKEWANLMVEIGMEREISIRTQHEPTTTPIVIAPNLDATMVDLRIDVKVEEIEAA